MGRKKGPLREAQALLEEDLASFQFETWRIMAKDSDRKKRDLRLCQILGHYLEQMKKHDEIFPLLQIFDRTNVTEMIKRVDVVLQKAYKEEI